MKRYDAKRDISEKEIVKALRAAGASVWLMDSPCDLLVGYNGLALIAECKTPGTHYGKKLNKSQQEFAKTWRGPPILILYDGESAIRQLQEIAKAWGKAA